MGGVMANQASWLDKFPYMTLLDSKSHLPLLVDVGDNVGHDMERFRESHPETAARLLPARSSRGHSALQVSGFRPENGLRFLHPSSLSKVRLLPRICSDGKTPH